MGRDLNLFLLAMLASGPTHAQDTARCQPQLLFASDTQQPMRVEELFLQSDDNTRATAALFTDMLRQEPTDLFLLGDLVNLGYKTRRWNTMDTVLQRAKDRGFRVHAILGNHELMGLAGRGERHFQQRFPSHVRTGYSVRCGGVLVLLLNSNFRKLTDADIATQDRWYTNALAQADSTPDIRAVIVCCHHSPYSSSKLVGSSPQVQQHLVPPFMRSAKAGLFITGHAHLFQHFMKEQKHFFVIGGGGGLHHPLKKDPGPEVCLEPDYDPLFHYLTVSLCDDTLKVVSHRLDAGFDAFDVGCDYVIPLPPDPTTMRPH